MVLHHVSLYFVLVKTIGDFALVQVHQPSSQPFLLFDYLFVIIFPQYVCIKQSLKKSYERKKILSPYHLNYPCSICHTTQDKSGPLPQLNGLNGVNYPTLLILNFQLRCLIQSHTYILTYFSSQASVSQIASSPEKHLYY